MSDGRRWYHRISEPAISAAILTAVGGPLMFVTGREYLSAAVAIAVLIVLNVAYWRWRGVPLAEVYER